jgi:hypothetical protein
MAISGPLKVDCAEVFPHGLGVVSEVTPLADFSASTKENRVQARDKETGLPMWQVEVLDFDPQAQGEDVPGEGRGRSPAGAPDAVAGVPVRPVILEGLTVTPYVKEGTNRIAYSLRCTGLSAPGRRSADPGKAA